MDLGGLSGALAVAARRVDVGWPDGTTSTPGHGKRGVDACLWLGSMSSAMVPMAIGTSPVRVAQAQVARQLGVARQNVSRWHTRWRQAGQEALRSAGPTGPDPRLSEAQRAAIDQALRQGARAHGFDTDHWTLARITAVIEQLTGTRYHPGRRCCVAPTCRELERDLDL
jgi:hypothetical protein